MNEACLLLGSNIDPEKNIPLALQSLRQSPLIRVVQISSIWQTAAVGSAGADFLNVAVKVLVDCEFDCLKQMILSEIEKELGRVRTADKNAPRTIDLDVVVYNQKVMEDSLFELDHLILPVSELMPQIYSDKYHCTLEERAAQRLHLTNAKKVNLDY